ncbi:GNAT family N-acetyltransferase [Flavobacterium beibuense]|uniref:GNAT family acetyltransferase n=1 Tax=Flavobacterium beibuense TaxID=657326 RepID=A0A444W3Z3_9FLAO|nr:GNAT family N-acetyltransferase [Flavobacterium beibuense]RYJ40493.1 GNAT family acetyltransferase [Flavobacterium beibuense]
MELNYRINSVPHTLDIIDLYTSAGLKRPVEDAERIGTMYANSNLIVSVYHEDRLVGVARSVTDFCYCCYLSDLAIREEYKNLGIGKRLIELTQERLGDKVALLLLSAPGAMEYYPKVGFEKIENGFIIHRKV